MNNQRERNNEVQSERKTTNISIQEMKRSARQNKQERKKAQVECATK